MYDLIWVGNNLVPRGTVILYAVVALTTLCIIGWVISLVLRHR